MFRSRTAGIAVACVVVGAACTDISEPPDVPPPSRSRAVAALEGEELSTLQREWSTYAKQAPGFAGMFLDDQGNMVVRTVDMSEDEVLRQAVQPAARQFQAQASGTRVQPADYSFTQLVRWHNAIRRDLRGTTGFTSVYIDYRDNRIGIGFAPDHEADMRSASLTAARDNGVPEDALILYPVEFVTDIGRGLPPDAMVRNHTVRDAHDPLIGGTRVLSAAFDNPGTDNDGWCTMTLNVRWSFDNPNQPMWLTNAHCSRRIGIENPDEWYQPFWSNGVVGYDAVDKLIGPPGDQHGFADATMQYKNTFGGNMGNRGTAIGKFAFTKEPYPNEVRASGSLEIATGEGPRRVTGPAPYPVQGIVVHKTGARTGTTKGRVTRVDVTVDRCFFAIEDPPPCPSGTWELRENAFARYWSDGGDSGSPVFRLSADGDPATVGIVGQHWGHTDVPSPQVGEGVFSPWAGVRQMVEFGGSPICYTVSCQ